MYPYTFSVPSSLTDRTVTMGPRQLCTLMQDLVTDFFYRHSCDGVRMEEACGAIWIFTKASYLFYRRPRWTETVTARIFAVKRLAMGFLLNMDICAEDGTLLVQGRLEAVVLDKVTRRPRRLRDTVVPADFPIAEEIFRNDTAPWTPLDGGEEIGTFRVWEDDTDMNGHANNIAYVRWVLAAGGSEASAAEHFSLTYIKECMAGQEVTAKRYVIPGGIGVELSVGEESVMRGCFFSENG